jgi:hypothetical protein
MSTQIFNVGRVPLIFTIKTIGADKMCMKIKMLTLFVKIVGFFFGKMNIKFKLEQG